jgi:transposase
LSNIQIVAQTEYERAGRPSATDKGKTSHSIEAKLVQDKQAFDDELFRRSMFILATNLHADTKNECAALLSAYKEQHQVEKGVRFIKDPNVVASSFYVQKPERVEALMFVMTTCLAVYSVLEYRIRQALQKAEKTIPDQKGKATSNPTARWVFQLFVGIHVLKLPDGQSVVLNLKSVHRDILELLSYQNFYS